MSSESDSESSMEKRLSAVMGTKTTTRSKSAADEEQAKGPSGGTRMKGRAPALPTSKKRAASSAPKEAPKAPKKAQKEDAAAGAA